MVQVTAKEMASTWVEAMEIYTNQNNENVEVMAVVVMVGVEEPGADGYKNDTYKTLIHGLVGGWLGRWAGGKMDGWMDACMDGWMDRTTNSKIYGSV